MARPTSTPFRFATSAGTRVAMTAARKLSGWVGGQPVPEGQNNDLFGVLSDWVTYWYETYLTYVGGNVLRLGGGWGSWVPSDSDSVITYPTSVSVRLDSNGAGDGEMRREWGPVAIGGRVASVVVNVTAENGGDYDLLFYMVDSDGQEAEFSDTALSGTGAKSLSEQDNHNLNGPCTLRMIARVAAAAEQVTFSTITVTMGPWT